MSWRQRTRTIGLVAVALGAAIAATTLLARPDGGAAVAGDDAFRREVSYTGDIRPIVRNFCTTCHSGDDPRGGLLLTSYEAVREQAENGALLQRIDDPDDPMPQGGLLPKHLRRAFREWAATGYRNEGTRPAGDPVNLEGYERPMIDPVDIANGPGFEFLARMQGHWVGSLTLMGRSHPWFAFDYRAIAPSHVHGIFEGGTIGNLFTSFFVVDHRGRRTIMARNGGILNGIYRTSYFLLESVEERGGESRYRFVDALGGRDIMWIDVVFRGDAIELSSYTSRMGLVSPPKRHMTFTGTRRNPQLAAAAAAAVGFPKNVAERAWPDGLPVPDWGEDIPVTSASYMWENTGLSYAELGDLAGDPYRMRDVPRLARLDLTVERVPGIERTKLLVYLSRVPLTREDGTLVMEHGYLRTDLADELLLFPEIAPSRSDLALTYLHPGEYHLTVVADVDGDGYPSSGDRSCASRRVVIEPRSHGSLVVDGVTVRN